MRFVIVAGTPSAGKTSVMLHTIRHLLKDGYSVAGCKIDCLQTSDDERYRGLGIPVAVGLSEYICPDHFYVANLEEVEQWAREQKAEVVVLETAGLCHRCAPAVFDCLSVCVIDNLIGIDTPKKVGPMLSTADIVVITKGDIVSQAEREVFRYKVEMENPQAQILDVNGLTGQGSLTLKNNILSFKSLTGITGKELRYPMPAAICSYCAGETIVGKTYQMGNVKKVDFGREKND
ncbi:GTP-binding protein [Petroclostridium sp. X23]|uniref:GTP-binding protein n=1 Tax=Petroclostridium sp. X23 TaxID=3045146 RepID=UPI0024AD67FD|nr:GTP-binding protein [Petroclostridium sp. X23]WHH60997.1 GTP-binding protein [Petroclostridium sp. X23]